jgi:tRNA(Ile2)-agmatinylcytidine synthase
VDGVIDALSQIRSEPIERSVLFRTNQGTNQGTDMHLMRSTIDQTRGGRSYILRGVVSSAPQTIHGGHVIFEIAEPQSGSGIDCAAFEPTKNFRGIIRQLAVGDRVVVCGSVDDRTVHLEKIKIEHLAALYETKNPVWPIERSLECGWYEVPPSARRHIAKPLVRCTGGAHLVHPGR